MLYFIGAVITHLRARDITGITPAATLLVLGAVALVLRIAST